MILIESSKRKATKVQKKKKKKKKKKNWCENLKTSKGSCKT